MAHECKISNRNEKYVLQQQLRKEDHVFDYEIQSRYLAVLICDPTNNIPQSSTQCEQTVCQNNLQGALKRENIAE